MTGNERFDNDHGRIGTKRMELLRNIHKDFPIEEKQAMNSYFNTFHMYCENDVIERFRRLQEKLAYKRLMFKFDGSKYAIFSSDIEKRTQITDYKLTLEEVEDFAEKA